MSTAHFVTVAVVLGSTLCGAGCSGSPQEALATTEGAAAAALREAGAVDKLGETRWASKARQAQRRRASWWMRAGRSRSRTIGASARSAESPWIRTATSGSITGRGRWTRARLARCRERRRTTKAWPISALAIQGLTPNAARAAVPGAVRAQVRPRREPAHGMGGPSDPDFIDENCREADGCYWPAREHGVFVDHNDFVYMSGNGEDGGSRQQQGLATYPWAPSFGDDSHILKFTADGKFVYQIGTAGWKARTARKSTAGPTARRNRSS